MFSSVFRLLRFFEAQPSEKMSKTHLGREIRFFLLSCELCILAFVAHTSTTQVPVFLSLASPEIMSSFSAARSPLAGSVEDPLEASPLCSKVALADSVEDPLEASPPCSNGALADSIEDPLEASPLCSKVALADSVEDPLEASPLCSKVALADSVEDPLEASPLCSKVALADSVEQMVRIPM